MLFFTERIAIFLKAQEQIPIPGVRECVLVSGVQGGRECVSESRVRECVLVNGVQDEIVWLCVQGERVCGSDSRVS